MILTLTCLSYIMHKTGVRPVNRAIVKYVHIHNYLDWLLSLEQFFINVPYHILVASLTLMALF